jgi:excinuclease ABC subunit B
MPPEELAEQIEALRSQMFAAAENLEFETAARLRDQLGKLQESGGSSTQDSEAPPPSASMRSKKPSSKKPSRPAKKKSGPARKPGASEVPDSSAKGA